MSHPVVFFEVLAEDHDRIAQFYSDVFGWTYTPGEKQHGHRFSYVKPSFTHVEVRGGIGAAAADVECRANFYIQVENIEETMERIEDCGGQCSRGPVTVDGYTFATFHDPEGNTVGIVLPFPENGPPEAGAGD